MQARQAILHRPSRGQTWQKTWRTTEGSENFDSHIASAADVKDDKYSEENLIRAGRSFRKTTAQSLDGFHPRHFLQPVAYTHLTLPTNTQD